MLGVWDELRDGENHPDMLVTNEQPSEIDYCSCVLYPSLLFPILLPSAFSFETGEPLLPGLAFFC